MVGLVIVQLRAVQSQDQWRSISIELSLDRHSGQPPNPLQRSGGCNTQEVSWCWQHPSRNGPSWRSSKWAITALTKVCNKIWQTREWPTPWTQSFIFTHPKKGNPQECQNYQMISIISHPSKFVLKTILNRLKPQAEMIITEEQAGFRAWRSTTEQSFSLRILCEKHLQHKQDL